LSLLSSNVCNTFAGWFSNGPWRAKSVWVALLVVLLGGALWLSQVSKGPAGGFNSGSGSEYVDSGSRSPVSSWDWSRPMPVYVALCLSYAGGYCVGWFFRRLLRMVFVVVGVAVALLAMGRLLGTDTEPVEQEIRGAGDWVRHEVGAWQDLLKQFLPSAAGGGVGVFLGFRRRGRTGTSSPTETK